MIDRKSRDLLAVALRHYVARLITNDDLSEVEVDWRDRGAVAVREMSWRLYPDLEQHYAKDKHSLTKEGKREIARWIAFLYTDQEYLWPEYSFIQIVNWPMDLLTFGWWERWKKRRWEEFLEAGDFSIWPFCSKAELEEAIRSPRLMAGSRRHSETTDIR